MSRRTTAIAFAVLLAPGCARAQSILGDLVSDFKYGARDILAVWSSPFKGSTRDYLATGAVLGVTGLSMLADQSISDWLREHDSSSVLTIVEPFRVKKGFSADNLGSAPWNTKISGAVYLAGLLARKPFLRDAGMGCMASLHAQAAPRSLLVYRFVYRERPEVQEVIAGDTSVRPGDPDDIHFKTAKDNWYEQSFWGGHVANYASCISFLNHRFHMGFVEPVLWASVAALGIARTADQRHWFSDQLLGVAVGYATGKYVAQRSESRAKRRAAEAVYAPVDTTRSRLDALLGGVFVGQNERGTFIGWQNRRD